MKKKIFLKKNGLFRPHFKICLIFDLLTVHNIRGPLVKAPGSIKGGAPLIAITGHSKPVLERSVAIRSG